MPFGNKLGKRRVCFINGALSWLTDTLIQLKRKNLGFYAHADGKSAIYRNASMWTLDACMTYGKKKTSETAVTEQ